MHHEAFSHTPPPRPDTDVTDLPPDKHPLNLPSANGGDRLTGYHWFVLIVAALGWLFDCMDQQLFLMARAPAMKELIPDPLQGADSQQASADVKSRRDFAASFVTAVFIIGWATGGLIFGVLGDRVGRARVMLWTILIYSACTGLSALSVSVWDFALYRLLTGFGVGGEFAVGVSLVAEVMPERFRTFALGLLQALSAIGNISAALINMGLGLMESAGSLAAFGSAWRIMFVIGMVPALLALLIRGRLKEPERWQALAELGGPVVKRGSLVELFSDPRWRRNALVGLALGCAGVIGLWGVGFFSFDLFRKVFGGALSPGELTIWVGVTSVMQNLGGVLGIYFFSTLTYYTGRRPAFAVCFLLAGLGTAAAFWFLHHVSDVFWLIPLMGFAQLSLFGGYAIYFPELFPTRLRSTGTSFCYNVGRYIAAAGVLMQGALTSWLFEGYGGVDQSMPLRYAGVAMCSVFLIGLVALPFAPETKGKPLPE
jgi:MFS family permease